MFLETTFSDFIFFLVGEGKVEFYVIITVSSIIKKENGVFNVNFLQEI